MKAKLHIWIFIALLGGVVTGLLLGPAAVHFKIAGDLFIRLLKMIIVPLVMASMISGIVSINRLSHLGRIGLRSFAYYFATTILAVTLGLVLVNLIRPGEGIDIAPADAWSAEGHVPPTITSILLDIIPDNVFGSMARMDILPVIFFSLLFGAALSSVRRQAEPVIGFFRGLETVMMKLTGWIMWLAPIGVFALMASVIGQTIEQSGGYGGVPALFARLLKYMLTVLGGLAVHSCVTLPLLLWLLARIHPLRFFARMSRAIVTAFSTSSSAATLPITMELMEQNVGVSNRITGFVLPLGATVNMDGTALYEAVAAMFIAQAYGIELGLTQQVMIVLTATLASIGAAAIPSAGLVTMVIVLRAVNLPLEGIGLILAVDRLLDMCRTAVNVWGDSCGAAIVAKLDGETLKGTYGSEKKDRDSAKNLAESLK